MFVRSLMITFRELLAQGVILMMLKGFEVALEIHLQCRAVSYDSINLILVINMEDSKTHATSNKSKPTLRGRAVETLFFDALQSAPQGLSWLPGAPLPPGF